MDLDAITIFFHVLLTALRIVNRAELYADMTTKVINLMYLEFFSSLSGGSFDLSENVDIKNTILSTFFNFHQFPNGILFFSYNV